MWSVFFQCAPQNGIGFPCGLPLKPPKQGYPCKSPPQQKTEEHQTTTRDGCGLGPTAPCALGVAPGHTLLTVDDGMSGPFSSDDLGWTCCIDAGGQVGAFASLIQRRVLVRFTHMPTRQTFRKLRAGCELWRHGNPKKATLGTPVISFRLHLSACRWRNSPAPLPPIWADIYT